MSLITATYRPFCRRFALLLIICGVRAYTPLPAQTREADSLKSLLVASLRSLQPSDTTIIHRLNDIAWSLRNTNFDTTVVYAHEAFNQALLADYKPGQAKSLLVQGMVAIYCGHFNAGLDAHLQALDLYKSLHDSIYEGFVLNNIGYLYKTQGKLRIAKDYFTRAEVLFQSIRHNDGLVLVLGNLGDIALKNGQFDEALDLERKAMAYTLGSGDEHYRNIAYYHIGTVFFAMKQYDSASYYQRLALAKFEQTGTMQYIVRSLENLSAISAAQGNFSAGFAHAERGLSIAQSNVSSFDVALMCERLSELYSLTGKHEKALEFFRRTTTLRDSLASLNIEQRMKTLDMMRVAEKKSKEALALTKDQEKLEVLRNSLIIGIVFTAGLLILAVNRYRLKAHSEKALRDFNAVILRQQALLEDQAHEIHQANIELHHQNDELAALNTEKNEIMGIVSHDLKNPIGAVRGYAELIRSGVFEGDEVLDAAEHITQVSNRMMELVKNLLDINLLESGGLQLNILNFDVAPLVEAAITQYRTPAEAKSITLHFSNEAAKSIISADERAMMQVLDNLVSNAVKYSPHGKNVFARLKSSNEAVRVEIQDEGQGISPEDMKKMFGKFQRLSAQPTGGEHSTGLGLSIVKKMVEAMNGKVWCESELGKGAMFIVELPKD